MHPFFSVFEEWLSNRATGLSVLKSIEGYLAQVVQSPRIPDRAVLDRLQALVRFLMLMLASFLPAWRGWTMLA